MSQRWLWLCLAAYAPHLLEEHLTGMWSDPLIAAALQPLAHLPAPQAAYGVFQAMLLASLALTCAYSLGGRWQAAVLATWGLALVGESHHVARALVAHQYNPGLWSSLPMPVLGALVLRAVLARRAGSFRRAGSLLTS